MSLMLAVNVAVGIVDMNFAKLCKKIDAGAIGSPESWTAEFPIANITGEYGAAQVIGGLLQACMNARWRGGM